MAGKKGKSKNGGERESRAERIREGEAVGKPKRKMPATAPMKPNQLMGMGPGPGAGAGMPPPQMGMAAGAPSLPPPAPPRRGTAMGM